MGAQEFSIGGVVVRDDDCILMNAYVAFESVEEVTSQVFGVPGTERLTQALAEHVDAGLRNEGHGHVPVANIEIKGSCPMPSKGLIGVEELLTVPAFWIMLHGFINRCLFGGAQERLKLEVIPTLSAPLDRLPIRLGLAGSGLIRTFRCGIADPVVGEQLRGQGLEFPAEPFGL